MDDLTQRLRAEKSVIGNTRTFPSEDERDMVLVPIYGPNPLAHEAAARIEALEAEVARLRGEAEKWKKAFAAQSNKLQNVLHIPGVRAALTPPHVQHTAGVVVQAGKE